MEDMYLEIKRSSYYIHNYDMEDSPTLEKFLSVWDIHDKKYSHRGYCYDRDRRILKIPSGLELETLLAKLSSDSIIIDNVVNNRHVFNKVRLFDDLECKIKPRNKIQNDTVSFLTSSDFSEKLLSHKLVALETGWGKTACAIMACSKIRIPSIFISVTLSDQWVDRVLEYTNCELGKDLIKIEAKKDIFKIINNDMDISNSKFFVVGLDALVAALRTDPESLNKFNEIVGMGIYVFDESHEHFLKIIKVVTSISVDRIFLLSATPRRSNSREDKLYGTLFRNNISSFGEVTHNSKKYKVLYLTYVTHPNRFDRFKIETKRGISLSYYFTYIRKRKEYVYMFVDIIFYFTNRIFEIHSYNKDMKCLIYIQSCSLIETLIKILKKLKYGRGFKPTFGDYSGNTDKSKRHYELENNIIFTTLHKRAGLDLGDLALLINTIPISSEQVLKQMRGRLRDDEGWFVDVTDMAFQGMVVQRSKRKKNHSFVTKKSSTYRYDVSQRSINKIKN